MPEVEPNGTRLQQGFQFFLCLDFYYPLDWFESYKRQVLQLPIAKKRIKVRLRQWN